MGNYLLSVLTQEEAAHYHLRTFDHLVTGLVMLARLYPSARLKVFPVRMRGRASGILGFNRPRACIGER